MNSSIFSFNGSAWKLSQRKRSEIGSILAFAGAFLLALTAGSLWMHTAHGKGFRSIAADGRVPESPDFYLSYFNGGVEDFVIYNGLDGTAAAMQHADVLFLGNSRMQYAFRDRQAQDSFFSSRGLSYYMLAFGYREGSVFPAAIIRKYDLRPKWAVVNADPFFGTEPSPLAARVMSSGGFDAQKFRLETTLAFKVQRFIHSFVPYMALSQGTRAVDWVEYRSKHNGVVQLVAARGAPSPALLGNGALGSKLEPEQLAIAKDFQRQLLERGTRLVLTWIPPSSGDSARQLAAALGVPLLAPESSGLNTFDGSHLDWESSRKLSKDMLAQLGEIILTPQSGAASNAPTRQ